MAIVFVITVYSILIVIYQSAANQYQIERNLCLETAVAFMYGRKKCHFDKSDAQDSLENKRTECQTKCKVKLEGINDNANTLWSVDITFGSFNYYIEPCPNNNKNNMLKMFINCSKWNAVNVPFGGYCKLNKQCQGNELAVVCELGRCVCRPGYVFSHLECHEDSKSTSASSLQCNQEETNVGATIGALFGGLLLGVVLTTVAVMIIYWRSKQHVTKREEPKVTFAENESSAKIVDHQQNVQTEYKTQDIPPYSSSEEKSIYDHASGKTKNGQTQDDVYNHLHEQVKRDDADYYDHTCANSAQIGNMSDYSHLRHVT